ncbi:hypothetical protein SAMN05216466_11940 [Paraburkholderia phenazinium]|uniref:Uncharacterized protein n=1 Tax=Paraburkholderia phenazinium TaxID=60549 RepID=A0A1G8IWY8_9BURK|nr:hypothetical protein SAMN05216466_11940 [Paraburkholderia phenazinium]
MVAAEMPLPVLLSPLAPPNLLVMLSMIRQQALRISR